MREDTMRSLDEIGIRNKVDQSSMCHNYLTQYEPILSKLQPKTRIIIVGATNPIAYANTLAEFLPQAEILLLAVKNGTEEQKPAPNVTYLFVPEVRNMHAAIAGFAPVDLVIEDGTNRRRQKRELLKNLFYHLKEGGMYIVEDLHSINLPHLAEGGGPTILDDLMGAYEESLTPDDRQSSSSAEKRALANSLGSISLSGQLAVITKKQRHAWMQRESEVAARLPYSRTLRSLPADPLVPTCTVRSNNPTLQKERLSRPDVYPTVTLRAYMDVVASPGQVYFQGSIVLPDSFRFFTRRKPANRNLTKVTDRIAFGPPESTNRLPGTYYALDSEYPGHFGHVTGEVISRVWGWDQAKAEYPDLKALVSTAKGADLAEWQKQLFEAAGIARGDIQLHDEPVRVERLIAATPMFSQPAGLHPKIAETWGKIGSNLRAPQRSSAPERIFIGRKPGETVRLCRNGAEVEAKFEANGFTVVYPEDLPFNRQVELFDGATTIAGYGGSGMFNLMYTRGPKDVIVITSEAYDAINEYLISSIVGGSITYFWSVPDRPHPKDGWSAASFKSDFEFSFEQDGDMLDRILADLA